MTATTIQLDKSLVNSLKEIREHPRQTYNELLEKMGKYDRLATVWKGLGDPVRYALALAKKDTSV